MSVPHAPPGVMDKLRGPSLPVLEACPSPQAMRAAQSHRAEVRASNGIEDNDPASLLPRVEIRKRPRRLIDRISPRNEFVELQASAAIQTDQPRKIQLRPRPA